MSEMQSVMDYLGKKLNVPIAPKGTTCIGGTVTGSGCDITNCIVTTANVTQSSVNQGSGTLTCSSGYSGSPTYTCSAGTFTPGGTACTAISCPVSVTGVSSPSSVGYAATSTPLTCNAAGYTGSVNYTCTTGTLIVTGSCSAITCPVSGITGINNTTVSYAPSNTLLNCNDTGYSNSDSISYTCTTGTLSYTGACDVCFGGYSWNGSACVTSTLTSNVGVYARNAASSPANSDDVTWYSPNGSSWSLSQRTGVSNFQSVSVGLTSNDALGTSSSSNTIVMDLGSSKNCSRLKYRATGSATPGGWGYTYSNSLRLDYWNGSSWINVFNISPFTVDFQTYEQDFSSATARYWRITSGWTCSAGTQLYCS